MQVSNNVQFSLRAFLKVKKLMIVDLKPHELVNESETGNEMRKRETGKENARMSASVYL